MSVISFLSLWFIHSLTKHYYMADTEVAQVPLTEPRLHLNYHPEHRSLLLVVAAGVQRPQLSGFSPQGTALPTRPILRRRKLRHGETEALAWRSAGFPSRAHMITPTEHLYPHFTDVEIESQRGDSSLPLCRICPWGHLWEQRGFLLETLQQQWDRWDSESGVISGHAPLPQRNPRRCRQRQEAGAWAPGPYSSPALDPKPILAQATFQDDSACGQQGLRRFYFRACGLPRLIDTLTLLRPCQARSWGRKGLR